MRHLLIASAILLVSSPALAQDGDDYRIRVGGGAKIEPKAIGANEHQIAPLFDVDIARGTNPFSFEAPDDNFSISLLSKDGFSFGPAANIQGSRKNSDFDAPLGKVKTTFEAGAFAQYEVANSVRLRGDVLKGLGGHDGVVGSIGADKIWRDGDRYVFSIGPRVLISDAKYQRAYFGVTPVASLASGLPTYRPSGGVHAVALTSGLSYQFNDRFGLFGFGRFERLVGDAAKSPIVRQLGSRNQLSAGLGLSYTFSVKR